MTSLFVEAKCSAETRLAYAMSREEPDRGTQTTKSIPISPS